MTQSFVSWEIENNNHIEENDKLNFKLKLKK